MLGCSRSIGTSARASSLLLPESAKDPILDMEELYKDNEQTLTKTEFAKKYGSHIIISTSYDPAHKDNKKNPALRLTRAERKAWTNKQRKLVKNAHVPIDLEELEELVSIHFLSERVVLMTQFL